MDIRAFAHKLIIPRRISHGAIIIGRRSLSTARIGVLVLIVLFSSTRAREARPSPPSRHPLPRLPPTRNNRRRVSQARVSPPRRGKRAEVAQQSRIAHRRFEFRKRNESYAFQPLISTVVNYALQSIITVCYRFTCTPTAVAHDGRELLSARAFSYF